MSDDDDVRTRLLKQECPQPLAKGCNRWWTWTGKVFQTIAAAAGNDWQLSAGMMEWTSQV